MIKDDRQTTGLLMSIKDLHLIHIYSKNKIESLPELEKLVEKEIENNYQQKASLAHIGIYLYNKDINQEKLDTESRQIFKIRNIIKENISAGLTSPCKYVRDWANFIQQEGKCDEI